MIRLREPMPRIMLSHGPWFAKNRTFEHSVFPDGGDNTWDALLFWGCEAARIPAADMNREIRGHTLRPGDPP